MNCRLLMNILTLLFTTHILPGGINNLYLNVETWMFFARKEHARIQNSQMMQMQLLKERKRIYRENKSRVKLSPVICVIEIIVIGEMIL